jgi:hypothetical protein
MEWKIYYANSTYSDEDGPLQDAPSLGVQGIAVADDVVGRAVLWRYDYYWHEGRWFGGDIFGLWDYLARPGLKKVGFGRSLTNEQWNEVVKRVLEDPALPPKSGWTPDERRP